MNEKMFKIMNIVLVGLLTASIVVIAVLSTLIALDSKDKTIDILPPSAQADNDNEKVYQLANMNFNTLADGTSTAGQSFNIEARVHPFNASDKRLNWSLAWKNANSEWATGKSVNSYVTCEPQNENKTIAKITEKQAFGETIICTVSSVASPDKKASVEINHLATLVDFTCQFDYNGETYEFSKNSTSSGTKQLNINLVKDKYMENVSLTPYYNDVYSKENKNNDMQVRCTMLGTLQGECKQKYSISSATADTTYNRSFSLVSDTNILNKTCTTSYSSGADVVVLGDNGDTSIMHLPYSPDLEQDIPVNFEEFLTVNNNDTYNINYTIKEFFKVEEDFSINNGFLDLEFIDFSITKENDAALIYSFYFGDNPSLLDIDVQLSFIY